MWAATPIFLDLKKRRLTITMKLIPILMMLLTLTSTMVVAQVTDDIDPGILPDSPLYGLDRVFEKFQLAVGNRHARATLRIKMVMERMAEIEAMKKIGKIDLAEETTEDLIEETEALSEDINDMDEAEMARVMSRFQNREMVLTRIQERFQAEGIAGIQGIDRALANFEQSKARFELGKAVQESQGSLTGIANGKGVSAPGRNR